jgi:hypothetical protein
MKKIIFLMAFLMSASVVKSQSLSINGNPIYGDTVYIKKGSPNNVSFNVALPTSGILQFQWLMNGQEYSCNGQTGSVFINEKGRYKGRIIWYHDGTMEIFYCAKLYVKYINK